HDERHFARRLDDRRPVGDPLHGDVPRDRVGDRVGELRAAQPADPVLARLALRGEVEGGAPVGGEELAEPGPHRPQRQPDRQQPKLQRDGALALVHGRVVDAVAARDVVHDGARARVAEVEPSDDPPVGLVERERLNPGSFESHRRCYLPASASNICRASVSASALSWNSACWICAPITVFSPFPRVFRAISWRIRAVVAPDVTDAGAVVIAGDVSSMPFTNSGRRSATSVPGPTLPPRSAIRIFSIARRSTPASLTWTLANRSRV